MLDVQEVLGSDGLLARQWPGFGFRAQQLEMALAVEQAFQRGESLIAEAGTGTGKTFAYLVPALLSGKKVLLSTGTRNLQDQLYLRDLPGVQQLLGLPVKTALLKGRANYLCVHRLDLALNDPQGQTRDIMSGLQQIRRWSTQTSRGELSEFSDIPEDSPLWPLVTSTIDNCLGHECPSFARCHLVEARRRAQEADLVVINHHLLCADFALKETGFGELLPACDAYVIDEAHQLPEVASSFFGTTVSTRQLLEIARDTRQAYLLEAGDLPELDAQLDRLTKLARDLRLTFAPGAQRGPWREVEGDADRRQALFDLRSGLSATIETLQQAQGRGKELDNCLGRAQALGANLQAIAAPEDPAVEVRWFETYTQSLRLHSTPLQIAEAFSSQMARRAKTWIFTSATLAIGDDFSHFAGQLGLQELPTACWESPFDFASQALWFVPQGLPQPSSPDYTAAMLSIVLPLIEASNGRAFILFTSHRALRQANAWLAERSTLPLLVQGSQPKAVLLERFVEAGNAVLLGAASFWEGVDVRGAGLSLVIIDKLPFASPNDPVLQARLEALRKQGLNPFMHYQVPQAAIALKQGAGRLIRDATDRGLLVTCDPRMLKRSYGKRFLSAMPAFARTRELDEALAFCATLPQDEPNRRFSPDGAALRGVTT